MTRLIDADTLMYAVDGNPLTTDSLKEYVRSTVKAQPTVDAVEVVRCKDCKHYTGKWCTKFSTKQFDINDICKADDDFCSMADRKEHETD